MAYAWLDEIIKPSRRFKKITAADLELPPLSDKQLVVPPTAPIATKQIIQKTKPTNIQ